MKANHRSGLTVCLLLALAASGCALRTPPPPRTVSHEAEDLLGKAGAFAENARLDGSIFFLRKALDIFQAEKNWLKAVQCLVQIGNAWQKLGNLDEAQAAFLAALKISMNQSGMERLELSRSLQQLAFRLMGSKEYARALELLKQALALQQVSYGPQHPELGKIYNTMALLYLHMGDRGRANEYANKSLSAKLRRFLNTDTSFLNKYRFLDGLNIAERSYQDMSGMLDKSLEVYLESLGGQHPVVAALYEKLGMVCALQGLHEQALDHFRRALRICLENFGEDDVRVSSIYEEIGICLRLRGDLDNSRRYLLRALAGASNNRQPGILASIYYQLGKVAFLQGRHDEALQHYRSSIHALYPEWTEGDGIPDAELEAIAEKQNLLELLVAMAEALEAKADLPLMEAASLTSASACLREAVRLIDSLRVDYKAEEYRLTFGEKTQQTFDLAVRVSLRLYRLTGNALYKQVAFMAAEKSKAALLAEAMRESSARMFAGIPATMLSRERELKEQLIESELRREKEEESPSGDEAGEQLAARNRYYSLLASYQELIRSFEREYPRYSDLKYRSRTSSPEEIRGSLPARGALVEYFVGASQIHIFFLSRERFEVVSRPVEPQLEATVTLYCQAIKKIDERAFWRLSPVLHQALIAPIANLLQDREQLLLVPDRFLSYLPFETLVGREQRTTDFSRSDFLVRHFAVSYHFSAHLWFQQRRSGPPLREQAWSGFAPVFSSSRQEGFAIRSTDPPGSGATRDVALAGAEFPELPGTERELRSIIALFAAKKQRAIGFFHAQASEGLFKSPDMMSYSMIHLATHSLTNVERPKLSGFLFFPQDDGEDGILYADETYNLHLDCDLLVLSSCESGTGRLIEGEGLHSLTRGLYYSGARNIVFSLWKVEDKTTSELMIRLYREILQGESFSGALRQAKLSFLADPFTAFPKYWAGFILLGSESGS